MLQPFSFFLCFFLPQYAIVPPMRHSTRGQSTAKNSTNVRITKELRTMLQKEQEATGEKLYRLVDRLIKAGLEVEK